VQVAVSAKTVNGIVTHFACYRRSGFRRHRSTAEVWMCRWWGRWIKKSIRCWLCGTVASWLLHVCLTRTVVPRNCLSASPVDQPMFKNLCEMWSSCYLLK